jgi:hypothetical protein
VGAKRSFYFRYWYYLVGEMQNKGKSMRAFLSTVVILLLAHTLQAQRDNVSLLVQSPDGRTVKLLWLFKSWNSDITGFDIKRKDGLQDWVKLNTVPVLPEISAKKKLSVVEPDKSEESRVRAKLYKLLAAKKIQPIDNAAYLNKLNNDPKAVQELSGNISHDYDVALMSGFAFVDRSVIKRTNYEYGVFIQGTNVLLDSVLWNYGQIPDLNAVTDITSKATTEKKGIQITWNADLEKMKKGDVAGFDIYREGIRINAAPVYSTSKDPSEFTWYDKSANSSVANQYSISAESLFGIEGIIRSYTYNPYDHPAEYKKAEVTEIKSLGYYFKDGIRITWTFPKEYKRFIKGFYVEKDNMPAGYATVSPLLDAEESTFADKTISPVTGYIRFRVTALYNDKTMAQGMERIYNYFPVREPPPPQNIKATMYPADKKTVIALAWDKPMSGDTLTDYYNVYDYDTIADKYNLVSNKPVRANKYNYSIDHGVAGIHKIYITAVGKNLAESAGSDTLLMAAPSLELPPPILSELFADSGKVVARWAYPDIRDLKGFRLYQDKNVIADESILKKNVREFKSPALPEGSSNNFMLRAITDNGVLSDFSAPMPVTIPYTRKKQ